MSKHSRTTSLVALLLGERGRSQSTASLAPSGTTTGTLCDRCKTINFEHLFNPGNLASVQDAWDYGQQVLALGPLQRESPCPLCRLFFVSRYTVNWEVGATYHLRLFSLLPDMTIRPTALQTSDDNLALAVLSDNIATHKTTWRSEYFLTLIPDGAFLTLDSTRQKSIQRPMSTLLGGIQVHSRQIDYSRLRAWLQDCDSTHQSTCKSHPSGLATTQLRCIDCLSPEYDIVEVDPGTEYLALSYVWGAQKQSGPPPQARGKLPPVGVPRVIRDAITVVKALGKQYLWVDKYCVDQESHALRAQEIRSMDRVYNGAYATIAGCSGDNSSFGLPGVGEASRLLQPSAITPAGVLLSTLPPLHVAIKDSVWMTRGWTYQEAVLSRRILFFTNHQVYFVCGAASCCEAVPRSCRKDLGVGGGTEAEPGATWLSADILHPGENFGRVNRNDKKLSGSGRPDLRRLTDHIRQFTLRQLSYPTDILDAFKGILSKAPFFSYWGIPIAIYDTAPECNQLSPREIELGFLRCLLWSPSFDYKKGFGVPLTRRQGFPSWTWAGWKGSVDYAGPSGVLIEGVGTFIQMDQEETKTKVWALKILGEKLSILELQQQAGVGRIVPELTPYISIQSQIIKLHFQRYNIDHENQFTRFRPWWCWCHPTSVHPYDIAAPSEAILWNIPSFYTFQNGDENALRRITSDPWDCVLLFVSSSRELRWEFLIVEWKGSIAYRVGAVTIQDREQQHGAGVRELLQDKGAGWKEIKLG